LKIPGDGDPEILSDAPSAASGPAAGPVVATSRRTEPTLAQLVRHGRGKTEGVLTRQGSRRAAYERRWWGTDSAPGPSGAKAARVGRELQEGNMTEAQTRNPSCPRNF